MLMPKGYQKWAIAYYGTMMNLALNSGKYRP